MTGIFILRHVLRVQPLSVGDGQERGFRLQLPDLQQGRSLRWDGYEPVPADAELGF